METTTELGTRLREAREAAGLTLDDVAFHARLRLPKTLRFSRAKLARLETTGIEGEADPYMIQFLAVAYGVTMKTLSPAADEQLSLFNTLVDDGFSASGCSRGTAGTPAELVLARS